MLSSDPPEFRPPASRRPTLLYSWWITGFSLVIILVRLAGRKIRSNRLFREDWIMLAALIPLATRMALVHMALIYDTNNVRLPITPFSDTEIDHRSIGSRAVLAARIFYAMYIWACKLTVSEFLRRITMQVGRRSLDIAIDMIRGFLLVTFIGVVIAALAECRPIQLNWQVVPSPPPQCRNGYAHLLTMGISDVITDIVLIVFPIPMILLSGQTWRRQLQLSALFGLSTVLIVITACRMPNVIKHHGRQQYRTVWASSEILAATGVANAVILGSFLRDKGTKRRKFHTSNGHRPSVETALGRRQRQTQIGSFSSEENLFRSMGMRLPEHLQEHVLIEPLPSAPMEEPHLEDPGGLLRRE
ncbi:hypothetical protein K470DRAFT_279599 [Piedraia hortae CBS 480.64]|uniref:Rhodopsin domain-containing protein n=1 Tax=Piedraia hortae CBS 480.64 TaxID=1314780 RepID=A0A6A7CD41_9PEZI|nr:hypothetical protein K470DRAFT_279599 [Piedraia hortae CBS 480.64]